MVIWLRCVTLLFPIGRPVVVLRAPADAFGVLEGVFEGVSAFALHSLHSTPWCLLQVWHQTHLSSSCCLHCSHHLLPFQCLNPQSLQKTFVLSALEFEFKFKFAVELVLLLEVFEVFEV